MSILKDGSIAFLCKYPTRGKSHRVMQPMEFMARLAAIVPPPRFASWRYHGVLGPGAPWRKLIVPSNELDEDCSHVAATKPDAPSSKPDKRSKPSGDPSLLTAPASAALDAPGKPSWRPNTSYVPWAELLRHCFDVDILDCPRCHSRLTPVAVIRRQDAIDRILQHLALPLTPTQLGHAGTVAFDVTGELMPSWVEVVDPEPEPDARAPPNDWDGLDPPAPDF